MLIKGLLIAIGVNGWQSTQWSNETTHDHPSLRVSTHIFSPNSSSSSASLDRAARVVALFASASMDVDFFCNSALCWTVEILKGRGRPFPIRCHGDKFQRDPRNIQLLLKKKISLPCSPVESTLLSDFGDRLQWEGQLGGEKWSAILCTKVE